MCLNVDRFMMVMFWMWKDGANNFQQTAYKVV